VIRIQNIKRKKDAQTAVAAKKAERSANAPADSASTSTSSTAAAAAPVELPADSGTVAEAFDENAAMSKLMSEAAAQKPQEEEHGTAAAPADNAAPAAPSTEEPAAATVEAPEADEGALTVSASGEALGVMTLEFSLAGPMGMDLGDLTLEVKGCSSGGQADELGVGVGWLVKAVNNVPVSPQKILKKEKIKMTCA